MSAYQQAKQKCATCTRCPLSEGRGQMVWSRGPEDATYMVIGEGPGAQEDQSGTPFVGKSGTLLDGWLAAAEIEDAYITNTVKCRPPMNRAPFASEMAECWPYLEEQVFHVQPRAIILLGRSACDLLHPYDNYGNLRDVVGHIVEEGEFLFMALYHPAFILRQSAAVREEMNENAINSLIALRLRVEDSGPIESNGPWIVDSPLGLSETYE